MTIEIKPMEKTGQRNYKRSFHSSRKIVPIVSKQNASSNKLNYITLRNAFCEQGKFSF